MARITTINGLTNLPNLTEFRADWNSLEEIDFRGCSNLEYIDVSDCYNNENEKSLNRIYVAGLLHLQELRIDDSALTTLLSSIIGVQGLYALTWLDADQCNLGGIVDLSDLVSLTGFDLYGNGGIFEIITSPEQLLTNVNLGGCSLIGEAVDALLYNLNESGAIGGYCYLDGGNNEAPSASGLAAKASLEAKGWQVFTN